MRREYFLHFGLLAVVATLTWYIHWQQVDESEVERRLVDFAKQQVDTIRIYAEDGLFEGTIDKKRNYLFKAYSRGEGGADQKGAVRFEFWAKRDSITRMFDLLTTLKGRYTAKDSDQARSLYGFGDGYYVEFYGAGKRLMRLDVSRVNPRTSDVYMIPDETGRIYEVPIVMYRMVERPDLDYRMTRAFHTAGKKWTKAVIRSGDFSEPLFAKQIDDRGNMRWATADPQGLFNKAYDEIIRDTRSLEIKNLAEPEIAAKLAALEPRFELEFQEDSGDNTVFKFYKLDAVDDPDRRYWGQTNQIEAKVFYQIRLGAAQKLAERVESTVSLHAQMKE